MVNTIQMTQTGYDELAKELEELKTRDVISHDRHLACDFANFHCLIIFG